MTVDIQPIAIAGQHWVDVVWDDGEPRRYGPYIDMNEAEAMVARLAGVCRVLGSEVNLQAAARNG